MSETVQVKPRKKRLSSTERRAEFITKAIEFFAEEGFESSTRDLARHLGVTQPLLYRYFPSKNDLIKEVYQTVYLNRWREEWDELLCDRNRPLRERLQTFYEAYTDAIFAREWMRIFLFSGLKGVEINRWYVGLVNERILNRILTEHRFENGDISDRQATPEELELAWVMHGGIFYYGIRKHIYESPVLDDKSRMISDALDVFLAGIGAVSSTSKN
ncbi:MAG: TetR family transcriptional regulator [Rhizobiaceae bacterium]|nr:TetR family transcriptional regulator [Rhizobiaceae bacterium]